MNGQNFGEQSNTLDGNARTDESTNSPVVNSDNPADKVQVYVDPIMEMPMTGTIAVANSLDEMTAQDAPLAEAVHYDVPLDETITHPAPTSTNAGAQLALLDRDVSDHLHIRWNEIQGKFVDEPRTAVQQADELVSEVIEKINQIFSNEHSNLEGQWKQGKDVSTEDLRKALQHYRAFFNRLVI